MTKRVARTDPMLLDDTLVEVSSTIITSMTAVTGDVLQLIFVLINFKVSL